MSIVRHVDAERVDDELRVGRLDGARGAVRHADRVDVLGAERARAEECRDRRIDAAREPDDGARNAAPFASARRARTRPAIASVSAASMPGGAGDRREAAQRSGASLTRSSRGSGSSSSSKRSGSTACRSPSSGRLARARSTSRRSTIGAHDAALQHGGACDEHVAARVDDARRTRHPLPAFESGEARVDHVDAVLDRACAQHRRASA